MAQRQYKETDTSQWQERSGNESDGDLTISSNTTEAPIDSACTGTLDAYSLSATNASFAVSQCILIHQTRGTGAGNWELNRISGYTAGTITTKYPLTNTYVSGAQVRVLKQYANVTINSGVTYTAKAWDQTVGGILAFLANKTLTVTGTLSAAGRGFRGGPGTTGTQYGTAWQGEGSIGLGAVVTRDTNPNNNGSGGGGGSDWVNEARGGGGGGHAANGQTGLTDNGSVYGGQYGTTTGVANLTAMTFGGGGGGGGCRDDDAFGAGADGSPGGGIIMAIAQSIVVTGNITANGTAGVTATVEWRGGGGGGAGGSVLLKAQTATLGASLMTATGGVGGASAGGGLASGAGGYGGVGRIHLDYGSSYTGTTNPAISTIKDKVISGFGTGGGFLGVL